MGTTNIAFQRADYPLNMPAGALIAAGDFNGDGLNDLVVSSEGELVLLNDHGTFPNLNSYQQAFASNGGLAVGDINNDGKPDIIGADMIDASSLFSLLNNGSGTSFSVMLVSDGQTNNQSVALADLNKDGNLDSLYSSWYGFGAQLGNGDGTFQPITSPAYQCETSFNCGTMVVGDFNKDGKMDAAVLGNSVALETNDILQIFFGNGDGTFQAPVVYQVGWVANTLAAGDLNGDGKLDIAVINNCGAHTCQSGSQGTVSIFLNNGDGTFKLASTLNDGVEPPAPFFNIDQGVALGDLNGDGFIDLIITNYPANSVSAFFNDGSANFSQSASYPVGQSPSSVIAVPLQGQAQGFDDIAVSYIGSSSTAQGGVTVLLNPLAK